MKAWIQVSVAEEESDDEKGSSGDLVNVVFKGELAIKHDSEVADVWV